MFLSEFLIWNVSNLTLIIFTEGPLKAFIVLFSGAIMYIALFSLGADLIHRYKIRDPVSLILMGSIYGIILESIFSTLIYMAGFGPNIFGLSFSRIAFTTVSWHAVIDFFLGIIIFSRILRGKSILEGKKIKLKEVLILILFSLFWFSWSYSSSILNNLPGGIPLIIRVLVLLIPMLVFGILLKFALEKKDYEPDKILGSLGYIFCIGYIGVFVILRLLALPNKILLLSVLLLIIIYAILLAIHLKFGRKPSNTSIIDDSFPVKGDFSLVKYVIFCAIVAVFYIIFTMIVNLFHLELIFYYFTLIFTITCFIFAPVFPIYVIVSIIINRKRNQEIQDIKTTKEALNGAL